MHRRNRRRVEDQLLNSHNLLAIAEFLQLAQHGLDLLNKTILFGALQLPKDLFCTTLAMSLKRRKLHTDNVISILVPHQSQERAFTSLVRRRQPVDDLATLRLLSKLDALLHHVARELVLREREQLGHDHMHHAGPVLLLSVLDHVLDDIVAELVRDEAHGARMQLGQDGLAVDLLAVFQHPLDDSAAIRVGCETVHLPLESIDDELHILRGNPLDRLLNHVVSVLIPHTFEDMVLELLDHRRLLVGEDMFQCLYNISAGRTRRKGDYLLNHTASIHLG